MGGENKSSHNCRSINDEIESPIITWGNLLSTPIVLGESTLECEIDCNLFQLISREHSYDTNVGVYVEMNGLEIPTVLTKFGNERNLSESMILKSKEKKKKRHYHSLTSQRKKTRNRCSSASFLNKAKSLSPAAQILFEKTFIS